jgi:hypothetical protein
MPRTSRLPIPAIVLSPPADEGDYHPKTSRGKPRKSDEAPMKIATDTEMEFAMHQLLFNVNVNNPNYYSLASEGDRRWTFLGWGTEFIEVSLSKCRTRLIINRIGPIAVKVVCVTDVNKTILEVAREGFMEMFHRVIETRFPKKKKN